MRKSKVYLIVDRWWFCFNLYALKGLAQNKYVMNNEWVENKNNNDILTCFNVFIYDERYNIHYSLTKYTRQKVTCTIYF